MLAFILEAVVFLVGAGAITSPAQDFLPEMDRFKAPHACDAAHRGKTYVEAAEDSRWRCDGRFWVHAR